MTFGSGSMSYDAKENVVYLYLDTLSFKESKDFLQVSGDYMFLCHSK